MTYDFLADGLCPEIAISDHAGATRYRWEHPLVFGDAAVQDFALESWDMRAGLDSDAGSATVVIDDPENMMTDRDSASRKLLVRNGWYLEVWLRKPNGGIRQKWFHGIIEHPVLERPGNARQRVIITAIGWGVRLAHRFGSVSFYQQKEADGVTLDTADANAKATEIVRRIVTDTDILVSPGGEPLDITTRGVADLDIRMPDFVRRFQSLGLMVNEIAQAVGCVYGVTPDRDLFFHVRGARHTDHLVSNDASDGSLLGTWADRDRVSMAANQPYRIRESTISSGYSALIGLGALHEEVTASRAAPGAGSPLSLADDTDTSFEFRLGRRSLSKIAIRISRTGECTRSLRVTLVGSDAGSVIDAADIRAVDVITASRLNRELAADGTPSYVEVGFGREPISVSPQADMHVIMQGTADPVRIHRSGTGSVQRRAGEAGTWSAVPGGGANYRAYAAETMHVVAQDTTRRAEQGHKETTYPLHDFPSEYSAILAFEGLLGLVGGTRRAYDPITISAPGARPQPGGTLRLVDVFNGLDTAVELIGYRIGSDDARQQAAHTMTIDVEEWIP